MKSTALLLYAGSLLMLLASCDSADETKQTETELTAPDQVPGIVINPDWLESYGFWRRDHVVLQGFHWTAAYDYENGPKKWYQIISENAPAMKTAGFSVIWFPPPSDAGDKNGYLPRQLNNLNSKWGTEAQLVSAIAAVKTNGLRPLADVVVNHRVGSQNWADFTNPAWSTYTIVQNDEWAGDPSKPSNGKSMNNDEGTGLPYARDLDHKNPETKDGVKAYLSLLKSKGFQGWRWDVSSGYAANHLKDYNDATSPLFSIGEYFNYDEQTLINWVDGTHTDAAKRSTVFDFKFRDNIREAVVNGNYHYIGQANSANVWGAIKLWPDKAVTWVENHDSEENRQPGQDPLGGNETPAPNMPNGDKTQQAYAVILTHPGTPSVYWPDYFDGEANGTTQPNGKLVLRRLMKVRNNYGINSASKINWVAKAGANDCYAVYIQGSQGEIAVKIGPGSWSPPAGGKWDADADLLYSGKDWAVWGEKGKFAGVTWP